MFLDDVFSKQINHKYCYKKRKLTNRKNNIEFI